MREHRIGDQFALPSREMYESVVMQEKIRNRQDAVNNFFDTIANNPEISDRTLFANLIDQENGRVRALISHSSEHDLEESEEYGHAIVIWPTTPKNVRRLSAYALVMVGESHYDEPSKKETITPIEFYRTRVSEEVISRVNRLFRYEKDDINDLASEATEDIYDLVEYSRASRNGNASDVEQLRIGQVYSLIGERAIEVV